MEDSAATPEGPYFVDFCCPAARLVVEVVGPAHDDDAQWAYDQRRYAWLEAKGYRVMQVRVQDIDADIEGVMGWIYAELSSTSHSESRASDE